MIEPLQPRDRDAAIALLAANHLPTDDLAGPIALFTARVDEVVVGVVGLERCEDVALLRSLAVSAEARSGGIGRMLCEHVFAVARDQGIADLYLLTTGARDYFTRHGFTAIDRDAAPSAIRATAQFSSLCPSSAVVMARITR